MHTGEHKQQQAVRIRQFRALTARMESGVIGSGVVFAQPDASGVWILTAQHVTHRAIPDTSPPVPEPQPRPMLGVRFSPDASWLEPFAVSAELYSEPDWALLEVRFGAPLILPDGYRPGLPVRVTQILPGEVLWICGMPLGLTRVLTRGICAADPVELNYWGAAPVQLQQTDAASNPGNSGGPVVDDQFQLIGLLTAGFPEMDGMSFYVPMWHIQARLSAAAVGRPELQAAYDVIFAGTQREQVGPELGQWRPV